MIRKDHPLLHFLKWRRGQGVEVYRAFACALMLAPICGTCQIWEKLVMPGLTYRMEVESATPRIIHALRFSMESPWISASPYLANRAVYSDDPTQGRATVSEMVAESGAVAGVNADFFPFTGDPLGIQVSAGEIVSAPRDKRAVFAWSRNSAAVAMPVFKAAFTTAAGSQSAIEGFNEECPLNRVTLNTESAGIARFRGQGATVVLSVPGGRWPPTGSVQAEVVTLTSEPSVKLEPGKAALTATGTRVAALTSLALGDKITISWETTGLDWSKIENAIGGGPILLKDGQLALDWAFEGFNEDFSLKRHPRTAIGRTPEGDIWFVAIDGRQAMSAGATLEEEAQIMLRLGCVDAINLDGGGSTTFNLWGMTLNRPSDGAERPVANGILLFDSEKGNHKAVSGQELSNPAPKGNGQQNPPPPNTAASPAAPTFKIVGPPNLPANQSARLSLLAPDGKPVRNLDVLWIASGDAWIDQGGQLKPIKEGKAMVIAWHAGSVWSAEIEIGKPVYLPPPPKIGDPPPYPQKELDLFDVLNQFVQCVQ